MIGVDYNLFWTLNPTTMQPFIKAFELKQQYDDTNMWSLGIYIKMAIASAFDKSNKYPDYPRLSGGQNKDMSAEEIKDIMFDRMKVLNSRFKGGDV